MQNQQIHSPEMFETSSETGLDLAAQEQLAGERIAESAALFDRMVNQIQTPDLADTPSPVSKPELPKVVIDDNNPVDTVSLRGSDAFMSADPDGEVPDVVLKTGTHNPMDRKRSISTRVGIHSDDKEVGTFNVVQAGDRSWINDIQIESDRRGERLGTAAYLGTIAVLHEAGRQLQSDPQGLSADSNRVWRSLQRRGVAETTGERDQHGNPRYVSTLKRQ